MSKHGLWESSAMSEHGSDEIPVDEFYSGYSDGESYKTVASTVHDYQYAYGRRYHAYSAGGRYNHFCTGKVSRFTRSSLSLSQ